jgi:hypothetical protein
MRRILSRRPSPATIIAIVALVVALGGTAVAAGGFLPKTKFQNYKRNNNAAVAAKVGGPITYVNQTQAVQNNFPTGQAGVNITAACPSGQHAVGGGAKTGTASQTSRFFILSSHPSATGWTATVFAGVGPSPGTPEQVTVTAICEGGTTSGAPPGITP